jgi:hypothetical protein
MNTILESIEEILAGSQVEIADVQVNDSLTYVASPCSGGTPGC